MFTNAGQESHKPNHVGVVWYTDVVPVFILARVDYVFVKCLTANHLPNPQFYFEFWISRLKQTLDSIAME